MLTTKVLQVAIPVFALMVIGIVLTVKEFKKDLEEQRKKKKKK